MRSTLGRAIRTTLRTLLARSEEGQYTLSPQNGDRVYCPSSRFFNGDFTHLKAGLGHDGSMDTKASLWTEYRHSFAEFSQRVRELQALTAGANPNAEALTAAAREVQQARALYLGRRDALTQQLLRTDDHSTMWRSHSAMASSAC